MVQLSKLRNIKKPELVDKCRELALENITLRKENRFFKKRMRSTEDKKMNEQMEFKWEQVQCIPPIFKQRTSKEVEEIKRKLASMKVGEVLKVPLTEMYDHFPKERLLSVKYQYRQKIDSARKHLKQLGLYDYKIASRNNDLYIERIK